MNLVPIQDDIGNVFWINPNKVCSVIKGEAQTMDTETTLIFLEGGHVVSLELPPGQTAHALMNS